MDRRAIPMSANYCLKHEKLIMSQLQQVQDEHLVADQTRTVIGYGPDVNLRAPPLHISPDELMNILPSPPTAIEECWFAPVFTMRVAQSPAILVAYLRLPFPQSQ